MTPPRTDRRYDIAAGDLPPGDAVSCGNRRDLFKKQRRHDFQVLGEDVQHGVTGVMRACCYCGTARFGMLYHPHMYGMMGL